MGCTAFESLQQPWLGVGHVLSSAADEPRFMNKTESLPPLSSRHPVPVWDGADNCFPVPVIYIAGWGGVARRCEEQNKMGAITHL